MGNSVQGSSGKGFFRKILNRIPFFRGGHLARRSIVVGVKFEGRSAASLIPREVLSDVRPLKKRVVGVREGFRHYTVSLFSRSAEQPLFSAFKEFLRSFLGLDRVGTVRLAMISTRKFGVFRIDSRILPSLPRGVSRDVLLGEIGKKIDAGGELYERIIKGKMGLSETATLEGISNLMWFLQVQAEKKAGCFINGVISIEDVELRLLNYFDSCEAVYQGASVYFEDFQVFSDGKVTNGPRGIDFNFEVNEASKSLEYLKNILPYGKVTLMVIPLFAASELIAENRLLLRMEEYGFYQFKPLSGDRLEELSFRKKNAYNFGHVVGYAWGFIYSLICTITGNEMKKDIRHSQVPVKIANTYKKIIEELKKLKLTEYSEVLERGEPFSRSSGIHIMARNIESVIFLLSKVPLGAQDLRPFPNHLVKPINDLYNMMTDPQQYDHYQVRIGNEVIIRTVDLIVEE